MKTWILLPCALLLDCILGDPRNLPHPTRVIGAAAARIESALQHSCPQSVLAGFLGWLLVVGGTAAFGLGLPPLAAAAAGAVAAAANAEPKRAQDLARAAAEIWLVYVAIAPRDMAGHARRVARALRTEGLEGGRRTVSMIVGRDTDRLDEKGVLRATVESVAESTVDGVLAPLFWAAVAGPVGAIVYRAINTLDSMWGHKDERFILFGRTAARVDDAANWLPARLGFAVAVIACIPLSLFDRRHFDARSALRLGWRDRRKHESPNSAWMEALAAGALGLRLAGPAWYGGIVTDKLWLGEDRRPPETADIGRAITLMYATTILFVAAASLITRAV